MYETLAVLAGFALLYSVVASRVERTWISGPIIFTVFGLALGPLGLGWIGLDTDPERIKTLAELTLALVLFTDAAGADLGVLKRFKRLPVRLLAIGLPLTILLGFGAGMLLFGALSALEVALLATMLAPTDAALGKAVVSNEAVPRGARQGLNVESGLNDGICVPVLFLFLALATGKSGHESPLEIGLHLLTKDVGIGLIAGLSLSAVAAFLVRFSADRDWLSPTWTTITVASAAFLSFGTAQALGGSGFIASFVGGMLFGSLLGSDREKYLHAAEGIGDTLAMLTWIAFGAAVVGKFAPLVTGPILLYSVLSLTLIRMLPVYLCLTGLETNREGKFFIGWFGPRGLASIVFGVIVMDAGLPNGGVLSTVVACTVVLSIVAHGVTANPWAKGFGRRYPPETSS